MKRLRSMYRLGYRHRPSTGLGKFRLMRYHDAANLSKHPSSRRTLNFFDNILAHTNSEKMLHSFKPQLSKGSAERVFVGDMCQEHVYKSHYLRHPSNLHQFPKENRRLMSMRTRLQARHCLGWTSFLRLASAHFHGAVHILASPTCHQDLS